MEQFITSQNILDHPLYPSTLSLRPVSCCHGFFFSGMARKGGHPVWRFGVCLLSLGTMHLREARSWRLVSVSLPFSLWSSVPLQDTRSLQMEEHLSRFWFLHVVCKAALNTRVQTPVWMAGIRHPHQHSDFLLGLWIQRPGESKPLHMLLSQ